MAKWIKQWSVASSSGRGSYTVSLGDDGTMGCSCPAWTRQRKNCKHIQEILFSKDFEIHEACRQHGAPYPGTTTQSPAPSSAPLPGELEKYVSFQIERRAFCQMGNGGCSTPLLAGQTAFWKPGYEHTILCPECFRRLNGARASMKYPEHAWSRNGAKKVAICQISAGGCGKPLQSGESRFVTHGTPRRTICPECFKAMHPQSDKNVIAAPDDKTLLVTMRTATTCATALGGCGRGIVTGEEAVYDREADLHVCPGCFKAFAKTGAKPKDILTLLCDCAEWRIQ